ncbi:MAG: hypothetical protein ACO4AU_05040 [bacterium]
MVKHLAGLSQVLVVFLLHWLAALPPHWVHHLSPAGFQGASGHHSHSEASHDHRSHQTQVEQESDCVLHCGSSETPGAGGVFQLWRPLQNQVMPQAWTRVPPPGKASAGPPPSRGPPLSA